MIQKITMILIFSASMMLGALGSICHARPWVENNTDGSFTLVWEANVEEDLAGYKVYAGPELDQMFAQDVGLRTYLVPIQNDLWRYYWVTAYDLDGNESEPSEWIRVYSRVNDSGVHIMKVRYEGS